MNVEIWKTIQGYEGIYEISNAGRVRSLSRRVTNATVGEYTHAERIRKLRVNHHGYVILGLTDYFGITKTCYVHRLVAQAFIPNPEGKPQVNHIDGNKQNNAEANLEWCDAKENLSHAFETQLRIMPSGNTHWKRKGMNKSNQEKFYNMVGRACQVARERRRISITKLSSLSGEQHKTIRGIESGRPHSLHHAVWMKNILGIDVNNIIRDMEGENHGEESRNISIKDFI